MQPKREVLAGKGTWRCDMRQGHLHSCTGFFPKEHRYAALGTLNFLVRSHIVSPNHPGLETTPTGVILRLSEKQGDQMEGFLHWALKNNLLPQLERESLRRMLEDEERKEPAFPPLPPERADALVGRQHWQWVEGSGYPMSGHPPLLVAATADAETAFHLAHALHRKGFLPEADFQRINAETRHSRRTGEATEFRIAVSTERLAALEAAFPGMGEAEAPGWAAGAARKPGPSTPARK